MGAGRRTETHIGSGSSWASAFPSCSSSGAGQFLCLPPQSLASVIFGCTNATVKECLDQLVFGLPPTHISYVQNIEPGMPLFLFNYSDRKLRGIFEAASHGEMNINPYAWSEGGAGKSPYPAQVRVRIRQRCEPLLEKTFKAAIADNYHNDVHFWFELNHVQTDLLISLFTKNCIPSIKNPVKPPAVLPTPHSKKVVAEVSKLYEEDDDGWIKPKKTSRPMANAWLNAEPFIPASKRILAERKIDSFQHAHHSSVDELFEMEEMIDPDKSHEIVSPTSPSKISMSTDEWTNATTTDLEEISVTDTTLRKSKEQEMSFECMSSPKADSGSNRSIGKMNISVDETEKTHRELVILEKLKRIKKASCEDHAEECVIGSADPIKRSTDMVMGSNADSNNFFVSDWENSARERCLQEQTMLREDREKLWENLKNLDLSVARTIQKHLELGATAIAQTRQDSVELKRVLGEVSIRVDLLHEVENLRERNAVLEHSMVQMASDLQLLKMEVTQLSGQLKAQLNDETLSNSSSRDLPSVVIGTLPRQSRSAVYLLGGHNGESWLGTVDMFSPATSQLKPVAPMLATRSYAAASVLMGHIYVFGGGNGSSWYETAETYDSRKNEWSACAPMSLKRGSLAGASVGDRIFAVGGGNGQIHFSDVECYDPHLGTWITATSMLNKRFCVAAAELDGALYALGGYDDRKYLKSVERFDPREALWTSVAPMNKKRGSLSAAVLAGKLFALGGFDGSEFLNSVEVYDPRANRWMEMEKHMQTRRAYGTAAVVDDTLHVIGGLDGRSYIDIVECYRESSGWELLQFPVVGKRCFLAGAVLDFPHHV